MASLCTRCALRLRRAADSANGFPISRSFSTTTAVRAKGLPSFQPTSNPELDALLSDFRYKHFLPAVLEKPQYDLVFKSKKRDVLRENPQAVNISGEEFQLEHLGGRDVMPNRKKQLSQVLRLLRNGEPGDWKALPNLLRGLHMMGKDPPPRVRAKIIRLASTNGCFGTILQCLKTAKDTGLTLSDPETLEATIWGLRQVADREDWSEEATAKAIKYANDVAAQLESDEHGTGQYVKKNDTRRSPFVLGVLLELAAVYAWRFKGREDVDGKVKVFAERLLFNIEEEDKVIQDALPKVGPIMAMRHYAPILHGLKLADRMLGESMPHKDKAKEVMQNYERVLSGMSTRLEETHDKDQALVEPTKYGEEALRVWQSVVADD